MQKSIRSKKEPKGVCNLLLSEVSMNAEPRPPVLSTDSSISDNTCAPSTTEKPRKEMQNHNHTVNNLNEERFFHF